MQRTRFCCAKSSVKRSSSMELESPRLDFPARLRNSLDQRTRKHRDGGNQIERPKQEKHRDGGNQMRKPNAWGRRSLAAASWNLHKPKSFLSTLRNTVSLWIRLVLGKYSLNSRKYGVPLDSPGFGFVVFAEDQRAWVCCCREIWEVCLHLALGWYFRYGTRVFY